MKINKVFFFVSIVSLTLLAMSCATLPRHGSFRQKSSYEKLFASALLALEDVRFFVVSSDINTGKIMAEKRNVSPPIRLAINMEVVLAGVKVLIESAAPLEARSKTNGPIKEFSRALRKRAPAHLSVERQ